jgi:N-methylhydantoinase A
VLLPVGGPLPVAEALAPLRERARAALPGAPVAVAVDCRYRGQGHALTVEWDPATGDDGLAAAFHRAHRRRYGADAPGRPVEAVSLRVSVEAPGEDVLPPPAGGDREVRGPAALPMAGATAWIPAGWTARVRSDGAVEARRDPGGAAWTV